MIPGGDMLRRIRAALTVGVTWALGWLPVGCAIGIAMGWFRLPSREDTAIVLAIWAAFGGISGILFALLLGWFERGRSVEGLRPSRLMLWGTIAGAGIPLALCLPLLWLDPGNYFTWASWGMFALTGTIGACSAVATIAIARRTRSAVQLVQAPT
jgi:hypothetical protein